jgi:hypothetical protein
VSGSLGDCARIENIASFGVPTRSARDAKIATQIATAQCDREGRYQFKILRHFHLRIEASGRCAGAAEPQLTLQAVDPAMVGAQLAVCQHRSCYLGPLARNGSALLISPA